jgi:hypothetical protein
MAIGAVIGIKLLCSLGLVGSLGGALGALAGASLGTLAYRVTFQRR